MRGGVGVGQLLPVFLPFPIHYGLSSFALPHGSDHALPFHHSPKATEPRGYKLKSLETVSHAVFSSFKADYLMCFVTATWSVLRDQSLTPILSEKVSLRGLQPGRGRGSRVRIPKLAFTWAAVFITITEQSAPSPHFCSLDFQGHFQNDFLHDKWAPCSCGFQINVTAKMSVCIMSLPSFISLDTFQTDSQYNGIRMMEVTLREWSEYTEIFT